METQEQVVSSVVQVLMFMKLWVCEERNREAKGVTAPKSPTYTPGRSQATAKAPGPDIPPLYWVGSSTGKMPQVCLE